MNNPSKIRTHGVRHHRVFHVAEKDTRRSRYIRCPGCGLYYEYRTWESGMKKVERCQKLDMEENVNA